MSSDEEEVEMGESSQPSGLEPYQKDILKLVERFEEGGGKSFAQFRAAWRTLGFSYLHQLRDKDPAGYFDETVFSGFIDLLFRGSTFAAKVAAVYGVYLYYKTQPQKVRSKIPITPGAYEAMKDISSVAISKGCHDAMAILQDLKDNDTMFITCAGHFNTSLITLPVSTHSENSLARLITLPTDTLTDARLKRAGAIEDVKEAYTEYVAAKVPPDDASGAKLDLLNDDMFVELDREVVELVEKRSKDIAIAMRRGDIVEKKILPDRQPQSARQPKAADTHTDEMVEARRRSEAIQPATLEAVRYTKPLKKTHKRRIYSDPTDATRVVPPNSKRLATLRGLMPYVRQNQAKKTRKRREGGDVLEQEIDGASQQLNRRRRRKEWEK